MATKTTAAAAENDTPAFEEFGWDDIRTIRLPKAKVNEDKSLYVAVNGRSFNVPKGKPVEVPYPVYEVIQRHLEAVDAEQDFRAEVPDEG